jgi:creatinine amidohydrolase
MSVRLADATTFEIERDLAAGDVIALLPLGSTEAHGPHLPLATDVILAATTAERAALELRARGVRAFVLPPVPYAVTEFVADFKGTISVRAATVAALIGEIATSLFAQGFARLVLVNGHLEPEHGKMIFGVTRELAARGLDVRFPDQRRPPTVSALGEEFARGGGHAGGYETSLVMAARPELVRDAERANLEALPVDLGAKLRAGASRAREIGGDRAYFGEPAGATAREGERLYAVLVAQVVEAALAPRTESGR